MQPKMACFVGRGSCNFQPLLRGGSLSVVPNRCGSICIFQPPLFKQSLILIFAIAPTSGEHSTFPSPFSQPPAVIFQITNQDFYGAIVRSNSIPSHASVIPFVFPLRNKNVQFRVISTRQYIIMMVLIYVKYILTISEPRDIWFWPSCCTTFQYSSFIKFGRNRTGVSKWRCFWFFCFMDKKKMTILYIIILIYEILQFKPYLMLPPWWK